MPKKPSSTLQELSLPKNLREGQRKTIELVASGKPLVVTQLPTGYGKSKVAALSFGVLKRMGKVDRLLYLCPRRNQASQALELPKELASIGIVSRAIDVGMQPVPALRRHRESTGDIFIATIQGLASGNTWTTVSELMETGRWMVVIDEHHHYGDGSVWAERVRSLSCQSMLAMSATPARVDAKDYFPKPDVFVTYIKAYRGERAVKQLWLHGYDYEVDVIGPDQEVMRFRGTGLMTELGINGSRDGIDSGDALDRAMDQRKMRFSSKYVAPLLTIPAARLADARERDQYGQMIIQAMSCAHAEMICQQARALLPGFKIEWVGTGPNGRSDKENKEILGRFCPPKDDEGRRTPSIDVLVNVGMAGEGLDTVDVKEIAIMTPANITPSLMQLIGRAARRVEGGEEENVANINCDTFSMLYKTEEYFGQRIMAIFDRDIVNPDDIDDSLDDEARDPGDYVELPDEPDYKIAAVRFIDVRSDPDFAPTVKEALSDPRVPYSQEETENLVERILQRRHEERARVMQGYDEIASLRQTVDRSVNQVARLVIRIVAKSGRSIEKSLAKDLRTRIGGKKSQMFGRVKDCDEDDLLQHYRWLKQLEKEILPALDTGDLRVIPTWLL